MSTKDEAREATRGEHVRDRIRELTARALRGRVPRGGEVSGLVNEVLEGATEGIDQSVPDSPRSVLRQVYEGMSEAVQAVSSAGRRAVKSAAGRGQRIVSRDVPAARRGLRTANDEFLGAVSRFAERVSGEARDELNELVRRARLATPGVVDPARDAAKAADGHLLELTGEAARAGVSLIRRAASGLAMAAGGLIEGIGEAVRPAAKPRAARRAAPKRKAGAPQRKSTSVKRKPASAKRKPVKRARSSRRK